MVYAAAAVTFSLRLACPAAAHAGPPARHSSLPASRAVILPASAGRYMLGVASPRYWTPSRADVRRLEADLPRLRSPGGTPITPDITHYYRQYLGIVAGRRRLIYVNGFAAPPSAEGANDWRRRPVFVNDGGTGFFHVIYDPRTRRFQDFGFNGEA